MSFQKVVSIIIPVYNVEKYLRQCLTSITSQTYSNLEIIIINDGSRDKCNLIIDEFEKQDSRIKSINKENSGISATRNRGIEIATGEYIMFVDSDDWLEPTIIETLVSKIEDIDLVVCSYNRAYESCMIPRIFNTEGELSSTEFRRRLIGLEGAELRDPSQTDSLVTVWGKLYKAEIIKNKKLQFVSTKEIGTCEDLIFNLDYVVNIDKIYVINKPLYYYRKINVTSFTSIYKENLLQLWNNLFKKIEPFIKNEKQVSIAFNNRIALSIIGLGLNEIQNPKGFKSRYIKLKEILNHPVYMKAYNQLKLNYFPVHWKLFFVFAKYKFVFGVYVMLLGINFFVNKNN